MINKIFVKGVNPVLPTVYSDGLSYMEAIAELQAKINSLVDIVNDLNIDTINEELKSLKSYVDTTIKSLSVEVIDRLNAQNKYVAQVLDNTTSNIEQMVDTEINELREEIFSNTNVYVIDPTTGNEVSIQVALDNVYDCLRINGITALAYDNKNLTATAYDSKNITAYSFDNNGVNVLN